MSLLILSLFKLGTLHYLCRHRGFNQVSHLIGLMTFTLYNLGGLRTLMNSQCVNPGHISFILKEQTLSQGWGNLE